eukprot:135643_1
MDTRLLFIVVALAVFVPNCTAGVCPKLNAADLTSRGIQFDPTKAYALDESDERADGFNFWYKCLNKDSNDRPDTSMLVLCSGGDWVYADDMEIHFPADESTLTGDTQKLSCLNDTTDNVGLQGILKHADQKSDSPKAVKKRKALVAFKPNLEDRVMEYDLSTDVDDVQDVDQQVSPGWSRSSYYPRYGVDHIGRIVRERIL